MRRLRFLLKWTILLLTTILIGVSGLTPASPAFANASAPTLAGVLPDKAANDVDTPIKISGSGFSNDGGDPRVFLGEIALDEVGWVNTTTLTAQVPWGINAGVYTLKVVNPDGGEATLASPFEVTEGVGQWNSNAMDGGPVRTVLPIAGTAGLLYAHSEITSGVYRSTDYGAHWATVGHTGGQYFTYDPINPNYMYINTVQSTDGGATWHDMLEGGLWPGMDKYPGYYAQTFPDPVHSGTLFLAAPKIPSTDTSIADGLLRSTDYGQTWETVETGLLPGDNNVTAMEFYDSTIYLGTRDGNLYQSTDGGSSWNRIGSDNVLPSIGVLKVNPYKPTELWITTHYYLSATAQVVKMNLTDHSVTASGWPVDSYPKNLGFLGENTAFMASNWDHGWITENGGTTWDLFEPSTGKPGNSLALDPWDSSHNTFYIADEQYGVQKTTNRGATWTIINKNLHAMSPDNLAVDPNNPSLVYAKISENGWPGIFVSDDGGQNWTFSSLMSAMPSGLRPMTSMLAVSGERVFAGAHGSEVVGYGPQLFISDNHGDSWTRIAVDPTPLVPDSFYMPWTLKASPNQPETLLLTAIIGNRSITTDQYVSEIYRSTDHGETWQRINLKSQLGYDVNNLGYLAFDPHNPDIVYAAGDHYILKSSDNGLTWSVVLQDDTTSLGGPIAVRTDVPLSGLCRTAGFNRMEARTGSMADLPIGANQMLFVPGSDTLYIAGNGLAFSNNGGTTWSTPQGGAGFHADQRPRGEPQ